MTAKLITEAEARHYYELGRKAAQQYSNFRDAHFLGYTGPDLWPYIKAYQIGFRGLPFEVETFERIGDIRSDGYSGYCTPSHNYRDDTIEHGVSVMDADWLQTVSAMMFLARGGKRITLRGIRCGIGSDGEPVILPIA